MDDDVLSIVIPPDRQQLPIFWTAEECSIGCQTIISNGSARQGSDLACARYRRFTDLCGTSVHLECFSVQLSKGARQRIGIWLACSAGMTAGAVALGGVTRLTQSGLSMTNWHWLNDMNPPRSAEIWQEEFERYKHFPEYEQMNREMTLEEFKRIYYMEFAHRMWGRATGLVFAVPAYLFWRRGLFEKAMKIRVLVFGGLIGAQGALGWYMVKSGLHKETLIEGRASVSPYRLAAHLGMAVVLYSGLLWNSFK